jgi:hypothetical protein
VTLDIQIPYFTSVGDAGAVDQIIDAIIAAKDRGVTVRVITEEGSKPDVEIVAEDFHEHGIPVVYQDERWFSAQHNKGIIVDGRMVLISSINYSDGSISENREAGVIIENEDVAQWYLDVYDFDWSIGDAGNSDELNLYWEPNIPTSSSAIKVTVYAHMLRGDVDEVRLEVKIGTGAAVNNTITANVEASAEGDDENYFYNIPAQPDGTDIIVQGHLLNGSTWHHTLELMIQVRDSVGPVPTTPTTPTTSPTTPPTTPPPPPPDGLAELLAEYGIYIIAAVAVLVLAVVFRRR